MSRPDSGSDPRTVWIARHASPDGGVVLVATVDASFPNGTVVDLPGPPTRPAHWLLEVHVPVPGAPPTRVVTAPAASAAGAPHLWAVLVPAEGEGDLVDLVAFSTTSFPDGTIVDRSDFESLGIDWGNQAGAVRWSPATGVVGQVYVTPQLRRRGVAGKLMLLAAGVTRAMGWAALRGDGRLTDLGDAWLRRAPDLWQPRLAPRSAHLPPMTPPAEAVDVPERNLVPDPE